MCGAHADTEKNMADEKVAVRREQMAEEKDAAEISWKPVAMAMKTISLMR